MNALRQSNFKELCRACLKSINNKELNDTSDVARTNKNNLSNNKQLSKIFLYFTTLDVTKEMEDFPKLLCKLCLAKLMEYDAFRKITLKNTETLFDMLKEKTDRFAVHTDNFELLIDGEGIDKEHNDEEDERTKQKIFVKKECSYDFEEIDTDNDDDKLLLPELANLPMRIKPESQFEVTDTQLTAPSFANGTIDGNLLFGGNITGNFIDDKMLLSNGNDNASSSKVHASSKSLLGLKKKDKKSVYCVPCNKQFYKEIYLDAHIRGVHMGEKKPFQCLECSKSFKIYNHLYAHKRTYHRDSKLGDKVDPKFDQVLLEDNSNSTEVIIPEAESDVATEFSCQICWRNYSSRRALNEHMNRHNQVKQHICPDCGVAKVTRTELLTHMRVHMPNAEKFPCPQCPQVFNHKNAISRHVKVVHEGERRFPCSFCSKRFSTRNSQMCHERLHTGEKPFSCEICNKGFAQQESLRSHMKNHDKSLRKHVCAYCSQRFITLKNLVDHEKRHLGDKPHICNVCSKGFANPTDLEKHKKFHEDEVEGTEVYNNLDYRPHICNICSKVFDTAESLQIHRKSYHNAANTFGGNAVDHKPFICFICSKAFDSKESLQNHRLIHHNHDTVNKYELEQEEGNTVDKPHTYNNYYDLQRHRTTDESFHYDEVDQLSGNDCEQLTDSDEQLTDN